ncbi:hypothetical protein BLOT_011198, partial [Blomia tropicalis]
MFNVVSAIIDELSSHSTRNVWHTSLNFDNFMLPIQHRINMNFMTSHSRSFIEASAISAKFGIKTKNLNINMWFIATNIEIGTENGNNIKKQ